MIDEESWEEERRRMHGNEPGGFSIRDLKLLMSEIPHMRYVKLSLSNLLLIHTNIYLEHSGIAHLFQPGTYFNALFADNTLPLGHILYSYTYSWPAEGKL